VILFMSQLAGLICPIPCSNLGPLGNMNNAQQFHGRDVEAVWEIGGKRMFRDYDAVQQLALAN